MNDFSPFSSQSPQNRPPLSSLRRRLAIPAFAISFVFLFTSLLQLLAVEIIARAFPQLMDHNWYNWVLSMVPLYAIAMPLSLLFYKAAPASPPTCTRNISFPIFLGLLAICFAMTYAGNLIGQILNMIIGNFTGSVPANNLQEITLSSPLWTNLLFCGILAPIMEEIFYRKLLIDRLRCFGDLPAVLISGILFGLIHGNFYQFFYAAMIGLLFGAIYLHTGKIRYTVALHMCINLIGGVYSVEMLKRINLESLAEQPYLEMLQHFGGYAMMLSYFAFVLIALIGALVAAILLYRRRLPLRRGEYPLTATEWIHVGLFNPAVWILLLVVVLLFL